MRRRLIRRLRRQVRIEQHLREAQRQAYIGAWNDIQKLIGQRRDLRRRCDNAEAECHRLHGELRRLRASLLAQEDRLAVAEGRPVRPSPLASRLERFGRISSVGKTS